jgi:preprotein translocase subunit SecA
MLKGLIGRVVGDSNSRELGKLRPMVDAIGALEPEMERRSDAELRGLTSEFRERLSTGATLDELLPEAYAAVREAAKRSVDMRPFDVQLVGGIVLHQGKVAEMRTGEGKTLVATMPLYLNALLGRGAHLVTVNDYLARRDSLWMGAIYHLMGLSVGLLQSGPEQPAYRYDPEYQRDPYPGLRPVPRARAYAADILYGTNNEFGFDYLRDNLALSLERRVQRPLYYAIVDEVDNIFIDEARTPLIISGPSGESVEDYGRFAAIAPKLEPEVHYELDDKERSVYLTEEGLAVVEAETGIENIYDEANYRYVHYMQQALKAQVLFQEGRDYIRQRRQIILIDQHTGRLMPSRRLSEGLHQAIEAKEGVPIRPRDVTSATITIQNFFRMYEKLAGMSGTAVTESEEFFKIYQLDVVAIPTNMPVIRDDAADTVYRSEEAKLRAVARELLARHSLEQPVLVGTTSVEMSERLSRRLDGERLQMAALTPRVAYALQDMEGNRDERAALRETMNASLETMNSAAWRKLLRAMNVDGSALSDSNLAWIADYLGLSGDANAVRILERALRDGIPHNVLNAKEHTREAAIIARAGRPGAVTIATNMAGRGVDIKLGGDLSEDDIHRAHLALGARGLDPFTATPAQMDSAIAEVQPQYAKRRDRVLAAGGLHVLGTERHEARRIDNQLRGRSGRQGEPGSSRFFLSLEDDLMRRFGRKEMLSRLMEQIGDDFPIEHNLVSRTLERAQTSVEGYNFDIRKHLLEYDDVLNRQRETIYDERLRILKRGDLQAEAWRMLERQVDEYLAKHAGEEEQRLLFAGLDDVAPLSLQAPKGPFQGPVAFAGGLTAFPPFTISFLADQYADQPLEETRQALETLTIRAAANHGEELQRSVSLLASGTLEKYEERLDRFRTLLDEKIDDYVQLLEDRGQAGDARKLAQHLERTYPLRLSTPRAGSQADLEELRDDWLAEVEIEFHRQTCRGFLDRAQIRLPSDIRPDRLRPARLKESSLAVELRRVQQLAVKQASDEEAGRRLGELETEADADSERLLAFVKEIRELSDLDAGRLDRLVGHSLGTLLDELLAQYLEAAGEDQGLVRRELTKLRDSLVEGKKGRRGGQLMGILHELNGLVHLEIEVLEEVLSLAVSHEYDKWAQRQLAEIRSMAERSPLTETSWAAIAEHLMDVHYTQKQVFDRGHRRRATWMARLPFSFMAEARVEDWDEADLRAAVLASLHWVVNQREQVWGQQELMRWGHLSVEDLDPEAYDRLLQFLGERELGDLRSKQVEDLPQEVYDRLRFVLALSQAEEQGQSLGDLPAADRMLEELSGDLVAEALETNPGELEPRFQRRTVDHLREAGVLDDPKTQATLLATPLGAWDQATRDQVALFWGEELVQQQKERSLNELDAELRQQARASLHGQHLFVDEARLQRFLVHDRLVDLPAETREAALLNHARTSLSRVDKRKITNLDVATRQVVTDSLQRQGLFTDLDSREAWSERRLADLQPEAQAGFRAYVGRQMAGDRAVVDLEGELGQEVIRALTLSEALADPVREANLNGLRLAAVGSSVSEQIRDSLLGQLRAELETRTMEEIAPELQRQIHQALEERNYFVDQERVSWYERKTLAQLPVDLLRGLEEHLGQTELAEISEVPFGELPSEQRAEIRAFLEDSGLLADRAALLRLTQVGNLGELADEVKKQLAKHLGRQKLVEFRTQRPPSLAEKDREAVWAYLREQGYFSDEFKEELFAYQRLAEFGPDLAAEVREAVVGRLASDLEEREIGTLPADLQAEIRQGLRRAGYFVDESRLAQATQTRIGELPPTLGDAVEAALGAQALQGLEDTLISSLPEAIRANLWQYLDEVGYFVDEEKRNQILDQRLVDLKSEWYELVVEDLAGHFANEIGDQPVSDLSDSLRQGLRESLETLGYFESKDVETALMSAPLSSLRRDTLASLTAEFGRARLEKWEDVPLRELPDNEGQRVLEHLQAAGLFVDQQRLDAILAQPMGSLDPSIREPLVATLRDQETERLRQQLLASLSRKQRRTAHQVLRQEGLSPADSEMRPLRRKALDQLDPEVYAALLRDLGEEVIGNWSPVPFQSLDAETRALLSAHLGRRIMGRIERRVMLHTISRLWIDYLTDIEDLRRGIGLEAYGQRDPLVEYKRRAFELFEELGDNIRRTVVRSLFRQPPEPLATG